MRLDLKITVPDDILASDHELAQAAGRGVSNIVKRQLVERDQSGRSDGLPRTGYYDIAALLAARRAAAATNEVTVIVGP